MSDEEYKYDWTQVNPGSSRVYEDDLSRNYRWAMDEGGRFFDETSAVHRALRKIARRLDELSIPYAVVGGMALFRHGLRRFTEDVDLLVSADNLKAIHENLEGSGYRPPFQDSKNLRDTELGVRIEFLVTGNYPGDGKPKPVAFPDPTESVDVHDGIRFISLPVLIELKLASGMTLRTRLKDTVDVLEMIKALSLAEDYAEKLNPYVRDAYHELWESSRQDDPYRE